MDFNIYQLEELRESCLFAYASTRSNEAKDKYVEFQRILETIKDCGATHVKMHNEESINVWKDIEGMKKYKETLEKKGLWDTNPLRRTSLKQLYKTKSNGITKST